MADDDAGQRLRRDDDRRLERMESQLDTLIEEFGALNLELKRNSDTVALTLKMHKDNIKELQDHLYGSNNYPGIKVRVDRLEQSAQTRSKIEWPIWVSVVGLLLKAAYDLFTGNGGGNPPTGGV